MARQVLRVEIMSTGGSEVEGGERGMRTTTRVERLSQWDYDCFWKNLTLRKNLRLLDKDSGMAEQVAGLGIQLTL